MATRATKRDRHTGADDDVSHRPVKMPRPCSPTAMDAPRGKRRATSSGSNSKAASKQMGPKKWARVKPSAEPATTMKQPKGPAVQQSAESADVENISPEMEAVVRAVLTPFRRGAVIPLSIGGRDLLHAVQGGRVLDYDASGRIENPQGCIGFQARRALIKPEDQQSILNKIGSSPDKYLRRVSTLSQTRTKSLKLYCCSRAQHGLRGGRYNTVLRPTAVAPLIRVKLADGRDLNDVITNLFPIDDPFCVRQQLLCQQITWSCEDLEPHCDRERKDKLSARQAVQDDGVGDRITSLTLRQSCWVLLRETACPTNNFALRLNPGDVYTLAGDSRWRWQHAILLDEPVSDYEKCRLSVVFRIIEEHPD